MSKFTVDCSWEMYGHIDVEADSVEEAIKVAESGIIKLSDITSEYVSESFQVDYDTTLDQAFQADYDTALDQAKEDKNLSRGFRDE